MITGAERNRNLKSLKTMYPFRPVGSLAAGLLSDLSHYTYDINRGNLFLRIKNFVVTSVVVEKIPEHSVPNTNAVAVLKETAFNLSSV